MNKFDRRAACAAILAPFVPAATASAQVRPAEREFIREFLAVAQRRPPGFKVIAVASMSATSQEIFGGRTPSPAVFQQQLPNAPLSLIDAFLKAVARPRDLDFSGVAPPGLRVYAVSDTKLAQVFNKKQPPAAWRDFRAAFPGANGLVRISRPAIDPASGQALIYMSMTPEGPGGSGHIYLLQREGPQWKVTGDFQTWVG